MEVSFSGQSCYQPYQGVDTIVMTTNTEISEFLEEITEVPETVEDDLTVFKHANDATESCKLICTEPFHWVPKQIVESFVIQANTFEVGLQGSLVLYGF